MTMQTIRRGAALGVFLAVLLTIGSPRGAVAHGETGSDLGTYSDRANRESDHGPLQTT